MLWKVWNGPQSKGLHMLELRGDEYIVFSAVTSPPLIVVSRGLFSVFIRSRGIHMMEPCLLSM